ncbi:MAG: hypothetical protein R3316_10605 [Rhodovibrionaceae bacterium]|nr:hypothetical protein [Rhodovibrionaceae bacterium]
MTRKSIARAGVSLAGVLALVLVLEPVQGTAQTTDDQSRMGGQHMMRSDDMPRGTQAPRSGPRESERDDYGYGHHHAGDDDHRYGRHYGHRHDHEGYGHRGRDSDDYRGHGHYGEHHDHHHGAAGRHMHDQGMMHRKMHRGMHEGMHAGPRHGMHQGMQGTGMPGPGMRGPGMHGPGMQGPGMHGPGMHGGMRRGIGPGMIYGMAPVAKPDLAPEDVAADFRERLERHGNPRLKLGKVEVVPDDEDTIVVEIVTRDDSLVQRWLVDRASGRLRQGE